MTLADALWAARATHLAGILSFAGVATFRAVVLDPRRGTSLSRDRLAALSLATALLAGVAWLLSQSAAIGEARTVAETLSVTRVVLDVTVFGHALLLRLVLLTAAAASWRWRWMAAGFALAAAGAEAGVGHAIAAGGFALPLANALHVAAAGAWLGGLLPLLLLVRSQPDLAARAAARFTPLGVVCVLTLAATAIVQGRALVGGLPGLAGTAYGHVAALKLALFGVLTGIAAINHRWLAPAAGRRPRRLVRSIGVEVMAGIAMVATAAKLSQMDPGAHTQPVWPIAWQPNFSVLSDPDLGREAALGAALSGATLILLAAAAAWRRARVAALTLAACAGAAAWPHLDLLAAPAYPTSFYESPTGFSAQSIAAGQALFAAHCAACHGPDGHGDGPVTPPGGIAAADLTAAHIWEHPDGELYWWVTHGIAGPDGSLAMPGFPALADDDVWALIDFVHANAAGAAMALAGAWPAPLQAPGLSAACPDGRTLTNDDLRGGAWRITAGAQTSPGGLPAIRLGSAGTDCADGDDAARRAYALVTSVPPGALDGTQFLVDADGWLRDRARPGEALDMRRAAQPLSGSPGHHHH